MILDEKTYVEQARKVMEGLASNKDKRGNVQMVTTSKIRNLLSMTADIYNEVLICMQEELGAELCGRINYLKVRFLYEAGRDDGREKLVRKFVEEAKIIEYLDEIKGSKKRYIDFYHYMEALIAYHKFLGGKDC